MPLCGAILHPEDGPGPRQRGVALRTGEGPGHEVIANPSHQRVRVFHIVQCARTCPGISRAASPVVQLLPAALEKAARLLIEDELRQAEQEQQVEDGLAEHHLHDPVLERLGPEDLIRVDVLQVLPEAHVPEVQVGIALLVEEAVQKCEGSLLLIRVSLMGHLAKADSAAGRAPGPSKQPVGEHTRTLAQAAGRCVRPEGRTAGVPA
mmetsp:Transcript_40742/g.86762  ORF Transcript_40742/g.86762 Transcript_40742/m.86762 type:complete len:207 (-) Transcript_40742:23-643(-)